MDMDQQVQQQQQQQLMHPAQQQQLIPSNMLPQQPTAYYPDPNPDLTGGLPISLDSLRDGPAGSKPFYPYSTLIRYAIKGSPTGKLLLEDIYYAIESRFPYFRTAPSGWKNSVRHNLSLNPCFEKVARPLTDRGKGSYWTVNDNVDPRTGVHRIRKKKTKGSKGTSNSDDLDADYVPPPGGPYDAADPYGPPMDHEEGSSRPPYPPYPPFDPSYPPHPLMPPPGMMPPFPEDAFDVDEHGNIDWQSTWKKELGQLLHVTEQQEKAGADQEWYKIMLWRLKSAFLPPMQPGDTVVHVPGPPPPHPLPHHGHSQEPRQ